MKFSKNNLTLATYGTSNNCINVTEFIKNYKDKDILVSNHTFGEDPHFGMRKQLTIKYILDTGGEDELIFYEGTRINLCDDTLTFVREVPYNGSSHIPILSSCLQKIEGSVVELGSGFYSTNIINLYANLKKVKCLSYESFGDYAMFLNEHNNYFDINYIKSYDDIDIRHNVDLLFIDHGPVERRKVDIRKYSTYTNIKMMLIHDTEDAVYGYDSIWNLFKYTYHFKEYFPYTSLVSNCIDVAEFIA